jgi:hypothetical protein
MRRGNRGQIRVIEAFLAVLIIFSAFTVSANLTVSQNRSLRLDLASVGVEALMKLDSDGMLGHYIADGNRTALREALGLMLPIGTTFNLTAYDEHMQRISGATVSNGGFNSQDICFVEYVCASRNPLFNTYIVHLQLAVAS